MSEEKKLKFPKPQSHDCMDVGSGGWIIQCYDAKKMNRWKAQEDAKWMKLRKRLEEISRGRQNGMVFYYQHDAVMLAREILEMLEET